MVGLSLWNDCLCPWPHSSTRPSACHLLTERARSHDAWSLRGLSACETGSPAAIVEVLPVGSDRPQSNSKMQAERIGIMDFTTHGSYVQSSRLDVQRHHLDDQRADYAAMEDRLRRSGERRFGSTFAFVRLATRRVTRSFGRRLLQVEPLEADPGNGPARM